MASFEQILCLMVIFWILNTLTIVICTNKTNIIPNLQEKAKVKKEEKVEPVSYITDKEEFEREQDFF